MERVTRKVQVGTGDVTTFANEMAEARSRLSRFHEKYPDDEDGHERRKFELFFDPERARKEALERIECAPTEMLNWTDFDRVAEVDDALMVEAWQRTCDEASTEFETGHRAAKVTEVVGMPWARAQFLSLREAFRADWQPRGGIEDSMIDTMVQAYTQYEFWLRMLSERSQAGAIQQGKQIKKYGRWSPFEQDAADAIEQAGQMAERFHRMYLRTIRAMRDYRRYNGPVVVQSAAQVNVGGQQVNVVASEAQRGRGPA